MTAAVVSYSVDSFSKQKTSLNKHMQIQSYRGDEQGRSCRHGRGEEHGREGSSPWGLGVSCGEGFQSRTSRTAAASRRRAGPVARKSGTSRGRAWMSRGGAEEEDRREEQRRGRANGAALPSNPPAAGSRGRAQAWPPSSTRSSRALIWRAKTGRPRARAHLARLRAASAPA